MEVKLDKRYPVDADIAACWEVLRDIRAVAACMPGAQITEQIDDTHYKGSVKSRVGPAVMSFGGDIELQGLDPAARTLRMLGKGADKSGSSASMQLTAHLEPGEAAGTTVLAGVATIIVSGKLAQFGSRLLVPVSDAMLAQFADNFRAAAARATPQVAPEPDPDPTTLSTAQAAQTPDETALAAAAAPRASSSAGAAQAPQAPAPAPAVSAPAPAPAPTLPPVAPRPAAVAAPASELNAMGLLWTVFKGWIAGIFGKR